MLIRKIMLFLVAAIVLAGCGSEYSYNAVESVDQIVIDAERQFSTHTETDLRYPNSTGVMAGTLYLPNEPGPHPVVIYHWGSGPWHRLSYDQHIVKYWLMNGIGVMSYDRRGIGGSSGVCCDPEIELLASDVISTYQVIRDLPQVDPLRIGAHGYSQGGWVVVNAAAREPGLNFIVSGVGPAVSLGEEDAYSNLTGDDDCRPTNRSDQELDRLMADISPSGYDPRPDLALMTQQGFWFYGALDTSIPWRQSIAVLEETKLAYGKDFEIVLFPNANHNMVLDGAMCESDGPMQNIVDPIMDWLLPRLNA